MANTEYRMHTVTLSKIKKSTLFQSLCFLHINNFIIEVNFVKTWFNADLFLEISFDMLKPNCLILNNSAESINRPTCVNLLLAQSVILPYLQHRQTFSLSSEPKFLQIYVWLRKKSRMRMYKACPFSEENHWIIYFLL